MSDTRWVFRNREEAGEQLASELIRRGYPQGPTVVLGIPNGGMIVAAAVAQALRAELDLISARRVLHPQWPETSVGAIAADGTTLLNDLLIAEWGLDVDVLVQAVRQAYDEAERRAVYFRGGQPPPMLRGKTVILVDDALITGYTMMVAAQSAQAQGARRVVIAVPTVSVQAIWRVRMLADRCICLTPPLRTVRQAYRDFGHVPDEVVLALLSERLSERRMAH